MKLSADERKQVRKVPPLDSDNFDAVQPDRTIAETAFELRCSNSTVYRLIHAGEIEAYKRGERTIVTYDSIRAMKQRNKLSPDDDYVKLVARHANG